MKYRFVVPSFFLGLIAILNPAVAADTQGVVPQEFFAAPNSGPASLFKTLKAAGSGAATMAGPATAAAIQNLGAGATSSQIAALVFAAVRAVPDSALQIVRAAVAVAPNAAPEIAAAAVRAVPNPWKEVRYQRGVPVQPPPQPTVQPPSNREPDFKSTVDSSFLDALDTLLNPPATGDPMSLAEAIVQTAIAADPGGDPGAVQGAVQAALFGDPGQLFNAVSGPQGISGVGNAGLSNYANEPHLPGTNPPGNPPSPRLPLLPPAVPSLPPVSP